MLFLYDYILHGIKKLDETGFDELEVDETAVDVPGPHLLFPSHLTSSSVHCLTFFDLTVTQDCNTTHISATSQISNRTVSMIIHN